ncbi:MAG: zinc ABC transporter solute-binding protein [Candidatus Aminicenantes bacterium]|nr:zinc ABC transporter solute-binding protein [Candidatus Aminicenantes bacterium]
MIEKNYFALLLGLILCWHNGQASAQSNPGDTLKIIATLFPLAEFAESVVGPYGKVEMLLPPGAEAHSWRPRPSDLIKIAHADMIIYAGGGMEPWLQDILQSVANPDLVRLEASQGLDLLRDIEHQHEHGAEFDPHIWLDFENDQFIIQNIASALSGVAPYHSAYFQKQAKAYNQKLAALDEIYRKALHNCRGRTMIVGGHAAFGYLARRYKLKQVALLGLNPDARPTAKQLKEVVDLANTQKIETVFFEELVNEDLARVIAKEIGAQTLVLNPGANLTRDQRRQGVTFLDLMKTNLDNLKKGLGCQ